MYFYMSKNHQRFENLKPLRTFLSKKNPFLAGAQKWLVCLSVSCKWGARSWPPVNVSQQVVASVIEGSRTCGRLFPLSQFIGHESPVTAYRVTTDKIAMRYLFVVKVL